MSSDSDHASEEVPPAASMPEPEPQPQPQPHPQPHPQPQPRTDLHPVTAALLAAGLFLTRLPLPSPGPVTPALFGRAMAWFPLVGAGLGIAAGIAFAVFGRLGLSAWVAATVTIAALIVVTGALHEDGLADAADGLGGGRDRERKLELMRDSRIGAYGALALILSVVARVGAVASMPTAWAAIKALAVAGALSRAAMVAMCHWLPPARRDGLSATLGAPAQGATLIALGLGVAIAFLFLGTKAVLVAVLAAAATAGLIRLAETEVGGHTGDLLGGTQQVIEVLVLVLLAGAR